MLQSLDKSRRSLAHQPRYEWNMMRCFNKVETPWQGRNDNNTVKLQYVNEQDDVGGWWSEVLRRRRVRGYHHWDRRGTPKQKPQWLSGREQDFGPWVWGSSPALGIAFSSREKPCRIWFVESKLWAMKPHGLEVEWWLTDWETGVQTLWVTMPFI